MKKKLFLIGLFFVLFYGILYWLNASYLKDNGIPIMKIYLKDTDLTYIHNHSKEDKYENNQLQIYEKERKVYQSLVTIKGRGNITWTLDKRPYQISFEEKTSLFDFPAVKKYVLLANAADSSLLRNDFSFSVAKKMGLNYSLTGKYIDLYVDDEYIGNYYIIPKIGLNDATVSIDDEKAILMELDNSYYMDEKEEDVRETDIFHDHLVLKDSESDTVQEDMDSFLQQYQEMERAIVRKDYDALSHLIDLESFAKYYLISEFSENFDAVQSSLFFYRNGTDDVIHIGPLWDFDITYGRAADYNDVNAMPIRDYIIMKEKSSVLFHRLMQIEEFQGLAKDIWNREGKEIYSEEMNLIDEKVKSIQDSAKMDHKKWKAIEFLASTLEFEDWVRRRYDAFNQIMGE